MATGTTNPAAQATQGGSYSALGIRALLLLPFVPGVECYYTTPDRREVSTLGLDVSGGVLVVGRTIGQLGEQSQLTTQGTLYSQTISLSASGQSDALASQVHGLLGAPVHVLSQDLNGRWWWAGRQFGLQLETKQVPGVELGLSLSGQGTEPAVRVATALIPGFLAILS